MYELQNLKCSRRISQSSFRCLVLLDQGGPLSSSSSAPCHGEKMQEVRFAIGVGCGESLGWCEITFTSPFRVNRNELPFGFLTKESIYFIRNDSFSFLDFGIQRYKAGHKDINLSPQTTLDHLPPRPQPSSRTVSKLPPSQLQRYPRAVRQDLGVLPLTPLQSKKAMKDALRLVMKIHWSCTLLLRRVPLRRLFWCLLMCK
jgi:hypothetical protein